MTILKSIFLSTLLCLAGNITQAAAASITDDKTIPTALLKQVPNIIDVAEMGAHGKKKDKTKSTEEGWDFPTKDIDLCWDDEKEDKDFRSYAVQAVKEDITVFGFADALCIEDGIMTPKKIDTLFDGGDDGVISEWCGSGKCAAGFAKRFLKVKGMIDSFITEAPAETKVLFAGHGYGGGVAQVAALYTYLKVSDEMKDAVSIITFGSPAVFDRTAANAFDRIFSGKKFRRVEMKGDAMPSTELKKYSLVHAGMQIAIDGGFGGPRLAFLERELDRNIREDNARELKNYRRHFNKTLRS